MPPASAAWRGTIDGSVEGEEPAGIAAQHLLLHNRIQVCGLLEADLQAVRPRGVTVRIVRLEDRVILANDVEVLRAELVAEEGDGDVRVVVRTWPLPEALPQTVEVPAAVPQLVHALQEV